MGHDPIPHPLAGRTGEGPPFAPKDWKWKAGQRVSDMYFCSPTGKRIRSQIQLQDYLSSIPNPPAFSEFCWRVGPEDFKFGPLPGVLAVPKKRGRGSQDGDIIAHKILSEEEESSAKRKQAEDDEMSAKRKRMKKNAQKGLAPHMEKADKSGLMLSNDLPHKVTPFAAATLMTGRKRKKTEARLAGALKHSFKSILSTPSSYKWLHNGNDVFRQFMEEAGRLKGKSASEMTQMRGLLLKRKLEVNNLLRYEPPVLCVFVSILRNEDPPVSLAKTELASLCVDWRCKHKQYWCLLEAGKIRTLTKEATQFGGKLLSNDQGAENGSIEVGHTLEHGHPSEAVQSSRQEIQPYSDQVGVVNAAMVGSANAEGVLHNKGVEEFTALSFFQNFKHVESPPAPFDLNGSLEAVKEGDLPPIEAGDVAQDRGDGHVEHAGAHWILSEGTGHRQVKYDGGAQEMADLSNTDLGRREGIVGGREKTSHSRVTSLLTGPGCEVAATICLCKSCTQVSFCRGCMCSLCKVGIWPDEKWKVLECGACSHVCHFLCAFNIQQAGVFKQRHLDGEFQCPVCSERFDLLDFWKKRLESAVSSHLVDEIEKHLLLAVLVLKDTERVTYEPLQHKVMEAHQLVQQCPSPSTEIHDFLQLIREELDALIDEDTPLGQDAEWAQEALVVGHNINWRDEEKKVSAWQKEAKEEYEEWERAEKVAEAQRALLAQHVQQADAEAKAHAHRATTLSLQAYKGRRRIKVMKQVQVRMGVTLEQVEVQRAEFQRASSVLEQLQHDVAYFQGPTGEDSLPAFSALLDQLMAQREIVESDSFKLDYMVSLYQSQ